MKKNAYAGIIGGEPMGINALFVDSGEQMSLVYLDQIAVKTQLRESFEDAENTLADLAESIRSRGVLQPILVRPKDSGYELVAGERRFRACQLAGLEQVPAYIREMDDEEAEDAQLAENIHRKNLTQIEEAKKIQRDFDRLGSVEAVLAKHQKSRSWLSKTLALLSLPEQAKRLVGENVSADIEVINTVKIIEKTDPKTAERLVDELKRTRGKVNARKTAFLEKKKLARSESAIFPGAQMESALTGADVARCLSSAEVLREAYFSIYQFGVVPEAVFSSLPADLREGAEEWLESFYQMGVQGGETGKRVVQGFRNGQFATEGEGAFALLAFLQGVDRRVEFDFLDVLEAVKR